MKIYQSRHVVCAAVVVLYFAISALPISSQTVINSARVGGYAEDITFVPTGALKDKIVILDGFDIFAVENKKKPKGTMDKLFNVKVPEIDVFPNGIAYVASEDLFVLNQNVHTNKLYFFDQTGAYKGRRDIQYLNPAYLPGHLEGLAYIPASSPFFPDHLVMVVLDDLLGGPQRLEIMRRDGVVEAELYRPDWPASFTSDAGLAGVSFLAPNRLLVTTYDNNIWTLDFSGNIVSGPVTVAGDFGFEGIIQMRDSNIAVVAYPQALLFLDQGLNRLPGSDRNDLIGLNLNQPSGIAWNPDTNQLLVRYVGDSFLVTQGARIASVPTSLDSATPVVNVSSSNTFRRLAYLSDEHLIAMLQSAGPDGRAIVLYNSDGTFNSQVSLSPASLGFNPGAPLAFCYIPTTHEFVVNFNGGGPSQALERRSLRVLSRTGTLVRTIDLTDTGIAGGVAGLDFFTSPGGDRFIILGSAGRVFITDLNGDSRDSNGLLFGEFNSRVKLGLISRVDITAITTGPLAGSFAMVDNQGGEVVIFRLD